MSNKLKRLIDGKAGEHNWFIAGGAAAFWHIDNYVNFHNRHLHDLTYYESIHRLIFPSDVEGNAVIKVEADLQGKYGVLGIELQAMPRADFPMEKLIDIDGIYVYKIEDIIGRYMVAQGKLDKRNTRVALLKIIQQGIGVNQANVNANIPKTVNLGAQIALGFKLKPVVKGDDNKQ